ncbi:MAG: IS256 family transposase, partial [Bacteroidetes bacterium]
AGGEEALRDPAGLLRELTGALVERALEAEVAHHLGYEAGEAPPEGQTNRRNGKGRKRLRTNRGEVEVRGPRDREGSFEPKLLPKRRRHCDGFDDTILAMYARGMRGRDIRAALEELYGTSVSPDLISRVTDGVMDELRAWQQRALEPVYCIVYVDAIRVKVRARGRAVIQVIYSALGVTPHGGREVLGLWLLETTSGKFWYAILEELRRRGGRDIAVLCADGLTGIGDAAAAVFPEAVYQTRWAWPENRVRVSNDMRGEADETRPERGPGEDEGSVASRVAAIEGSDGPAGGGTAGERRRCVTRQRCCGS